MFAFKYKYYLYIENTKDFNLNLIKKREKFIVIYRNNNNNEKLFDLKKFRKKCKEKGVLFYVANDMGLSNSLKSDGIYISAKNTSFKQLHQKKNRFTIIGSAHNCREISQKINQGCEEIVLSRLFKTTYANKTTFYGITKFNIISKYFKKDFIALGGIKITNLNSLRILNVKSFSLLSEVKKKPAKIINRLF